MKLKWFGHSCFLLTSDDGLKVLMDPYNEMVGNLPTIETDIVTVSHQHRDHNYVEAAKKPYTLLDKPEAFKKDDVEITGIATAHDNAGGSQRGKNVIFKVVMDGISICHCGDLGHVLTQEQLKEIGHVDVLLVPVGGFFTIDAKTAAEVSKQLKSLITIPMHYKVGAMKLPIEGVEPFIKAMGSAKKLDSREIELKHGEMEKYGGAVVFMYE